MTPIHITKPLNEIDFTDVSQEYDAQFAQSRKEYEAWQKANPYIRGQKQPPYNGFSVDYNGIGELVQQATRNEYPQLNEKQIGFVYGVVYQEYHSSFSDVICMMDEWTSRFVDFLKLQNERFIL